ncbi:HD-GYP domain-containing protein [Sphingomonas sp. 1P06PA]|uniref:HD-GYP domain-containing protein n=1 Tax=Sphingomonas sp. 1P06PA TaxID=554121 RepID=UPI0039A54D4D
MLKRVPPDQVRMGMYVHGFEGSWFDHPFWRSAFRIETEADLARIRQCTASAVLVDMKLSADAAPRAPVAAAAPIRPIPRPLPHRPPKPEGPCSEAEEIVRATKLLARSRATVTRMFTDARLGKSVNPHRAAKLVEEITASVLRNRNALIGVVRLKSRHEYTYLHSVAVCALMINLAREIGLDGSLFHEIGMAGLLHDLGKMAIPVAVLDKPGRLSDDEFVTIRSHPERGAEFLRDTKGVPAVALDVCLHHHEKYDGTGYPHGLSAEAISLYARMGAICDVYDAVTSDRAYKDAWTPEEAIARMRSWEGHFDPLLLESFVRSLRRDGVAIG